MTTLAACIVTYRSDIAQLREAIESLQRCTLPLSIAIVDNDSGADYVAQLRTIQGVTLLDSGANKGFGFGHNIGIKQAQPCDYYLIVNPDVVVHEGCIEAMATYMDANPDIGLLAPKVLNPDASLQPLNKRLPSVFDLFARRFLPKPIQNMPWCKARMERYTMMDIGYDAIIEVPFISGCFMVFRKPILDQLGGFDEGYFMYLEDCDITRRAAKLGRCVYYPHATITHHWARGSHKSARLMVVMIRSMIHYFNRWGWKFL